MASSGDAPTSLGHVLVTGGSGFLGGNIVKLLVDRKACAKVTVLDLRAPLAPISGVSYEQGDLTDYDSMLSLFKKAKPDAVVHTAGPIHTTKSKDVMYKVNVTGTENLLRVSQETNVKAFVYTSSASVISDTRANLINADETYPLIMGADQPEYYTTTKAQAEMAVLAAQAERGVAVAARLGRHLDAGCLAADHGLGNLLGAAGHGNGLGQVRQAQVEGRYVVRVLGGAGAVEGDTELGQAELDVVGRETLDIVLLANDQGVGGRGGDGQAESRSGTHAGRGDGDETSERLTDRSCWDA